MPTNENATSIYISKELREKLGKLKVHPRASYSEVIEKLLDEYVAFKHSTRDMRAVI